MVSFRLALTTLACLVVAAFAQPEGGGGRAPPDIRALDLAIDEARLDENSALVDQLTSLKADHMKEMSGIMTRDSAVAAMKDIDDLSSKLVGSSGEERQALHQQLHNAIQTIEDEKFVSMGMTEDDRDLHRALLREKHAIVIQLVDDDELHELDDAGRKGLMERFEAVELKMVGHMKDYFLAKAKADL